MEFTLQEYDLAKLNKEIRDNLPFLFAENENGGLVPLAKISGGKLIIEKDLTQGEVEKINALIEQHDPTPLPKPPTVEERIEAVELAIINLMMEG